MKDSNELKIDSDGLGLFTANTKVCRKILMNSGRMFVCLSLLTATNKTCHTGHILYHWHNQKFVYKMVFVIKQDHTTDVHDDKIERNFKTST